MKKPKFVPTPSLRLLKRIYYFPLDTLDLLTGRRDKLIPPRGMLFVGGGNFKSVGENFLRYFKDIGGLKPDEDVLDVGCGIGRMAISLTKYLNEEGSYEGFDVVKKGIDWCNKNITCRYPNFCFEWANIFNSEYNPKGKYTADKYIFPYPNESFDFVFLISVFTHMLPQDIEHYSSEIARILRKNGRCLITFFLLNPESLERLNRGESTQDFRFVHKQYRTVNRNMHEEAVAYDEQFIRTLYKKHNINIVEPIHYGSWCGRDEFLSYQDIILAKKII